MNKKDKIACLSSAMAVGTRGAAKDGQLVGGGEQFYHFADAAPTELKDLFLEHYAVEDLDYQIFNQACDIVAAVYENNPKATDDEATDHINEQSSDCASYYTAERLEYLNPNNEYDIGEVMAEYSEPSIANACAIWYDRQVEQAATIIKDWVNA